MMQGSAEGSAKHLRLKSDSIVAVVVTGGEGVDVLKICERLSCAGGDGASTKMNNTTFTFDYTRMVLYSIVNIYEGCGRRCGFGFYYSTRGY